MGWFRRKAADAALITDAQVGPGQDRHRREKQYATLMALRIPSLLAALLVWYVFESVFWAAVVVGITFPLPWIAVVLANSRGQKKDPRERNTYKPALMRAQMEAQLHTQLQAQQQAQLQARAAEPDSREDAQPAADPLIIDHEDDSPAAATNDAGDANLDTDSAQHDTPHRGE